MLIGTPKGTPLSVLSVSGTLLGSVLRECRRRPSLSLPPFYSLHFSQLTDTLSRPSLVTKSLLLCGFYHVPRPSSDSTHWTHLESLSHLENPTQGSLPLLFLSVSPPSDLFYSTCYSYPFHLPNIYTTKRTGKIYFILHSSRHFSLRPFPNFPHVHQTL